ncbi:MAG: HAD family hydrolase [Candidatus Verstraetearchaeota archaeon]|nr:HAD family hydrolase [Candidatus Verstraetearchaeota archaeon]
MRQRLVEIPQNKDTGPQMHTQKKHKQIRAVLFDMDNTLLDFMAAKASACRAVAGKLGKDDGLDLLNRFLKNKAEHESHLIIADYMGSLGIYDGELFFEVCETYDLTKLEAIEAYDGIPELLTYLKTNRFALGVVTNARRVNAEMRLEKAGLRRFFDAVVTADDTEQIKPDPRHLEVAIGRLGVIPEETIFVGDSIEMDIKAAKRLGMKTAYAKYGDCSNDHKDEAPDYVLQRPEDLIKILDQARGEYHERRRYHTQQ